METNQQAARAARRFLDERVRADWDWPDAPEPREPDEEVRGVTDFRERYYSTTPEPEPDSEAEAADPYKFDSPESIGDAVDSAKQMRKRLRREAQEEEMKQNEGLRCFMERRDVWTGAAAARKYGTKRPAKKAPGGADDGAAEASTALEGNEPTARDSTVPPPEASSTQNDPADPLIPVALPLLPDNPIRASIKPKVYPDIYNNIVVASRSPSVPINLADMTSAIVVGWKDNGEWPPKAAPLDPLAARKRDIVGIKMENGEFLAHHPHVKRGMDSVKRMFHLNGHSHENGAVGNGG